MLRSILLCIGFAGVLAACAPQGPEIVTTTTANGETIRIYQIDPDDVETIQFRMLDSVNALRTAAALQPVAFDAALNAAAATHARDMSVQNRPWHFGSDGSSPIDRVQRVGYAGLLIGENISETYETELQTLAAWMEQADTRRTILAENAQDLGFAWFQEENGKLWWVLVMGDSSTAPLIPEQSPAASRLVPTLDTEVTDAEEETTVVIGDV